MMLVTTETIPGHEIREALGLVRGTTVRAAHARKDIHAWLKNLVGGEIEEYTKLLAESREQALDRLEAEARERGADAVVGLRFSSCEISSGAAEFLAYGTAVKLAPRSS
ncbi:MAG: YbjQ family protein [Planctomycetes bacterium]|nr:YbjQ family protein [Planctomycetota bacterium]